MIIIHSLFSQSLQYGTVGFIQFVIKDQNHLWLKSCDVSGLECFSLPLGFMF